MFALPDPEDWHCVPTRCSSTGWWNTSSSILTQAPMLFRALVASQLASNHWHRCSDACPPGFPCPCGCTETGRRPWLGCRDHGTAARRQAGPSAVVHQVSASRRSVLGLAPGTNGCERETPIPGWLALGAGYGGSFPVLLLTERGGVKRSPCGLGITMALGSARGVGVAHAAQHQMSLHPSVA